MGRMDLNQPALTDLHQSLMEIRALPLVLKENQTLVLMEVLPLEEDLVEDLEDVPRKTQFAVTDQPQCLMETRALPLVLMDLSQSVLQMIVKLILSFIKFN